MAMSRTPRADLWFSVCLIAFGIAALVESWRMPRLENLGIDPVSAPGVTPGLLAIVIAGLGGVLLVRSVRAHAPGATQVSEGWGRVALAVALCLIFALGLIGRIDFTFATAVFVFAFCGLFSDPSQTILRRLLGAAVLAAATSLAVTFLFERVFLVRLP